MARDAQTTIRSGDARLEAAALLLAAFTALVAIVRSDAAAPVCAAPRTVARPAPAVMPVAAPSAQEAEAEAAQQAMLRDMLLHD